MEELLSDDEARLVLKRILSLYPDAKGELNWDTKFHLLCAVLMSAQTTDKMVNPKNLFTHIINYCNVFSRLVMLTLSAMMLFKSEIATRSCSMVSRLRRVTQLSSRVWWSMVIQYGVPMAS